MKHLDTTYFLWEKQGIFDVDVCLKKGTNWDCSIQLTNSHLPLIEHLYTSFLMFSFYTCWKLFEYFIDVLLQFPQTKTGNIFFPKKTHYTQFFPHFLVTSSIWSSIGHAGAVEDVIRTLASYDLPFKVGFMAAKTNPMPDSHGTSPAYLPIHEWLIFYGKLV